MKTRQKPTYVFQPVLMDLTTGIPAGTLVTKSSKAPGLRGSLARPFTWAYDAKTGAFLGMVCRASLKPQKASK